MSHNHITPSQTNEIAVLLRTGILQKDIAQIIGVTPSAISQEIKRNKEWTTSQQAAEGII